MGRDNRKTANSKKNAKSSVKQATLAPEGAVDLTPDRDEVDGKSYTVSKSEDLQLCQSKVESMRPDSLTARRLLEHSSVLRELHNAVVRHIVFYTNPEGGQLTMEEAIKKASRIMEGAEAENFYKSLTSRSVEGITWLEIDRLFRYDPKAAQVFWEDLKREADKDFKSGHFAAQIFEKAEWQRDPWRRAHFIAVRDSFIEQFKPQGGIDYSMIDMLAVTFTLWMHWTQVHMHRSTTEAFVQPSKTEKHHAVEYGGEWMPPRVHEQEAIDKAAHMADRWRRAYQATLRQMRDWRRYSVPVTINNPQQVNIATDGGQQVNLQKAGTEEM
ncbi:MAG TPA: hypothetical protein VF131_01690 [Blastocatellia bacterium]|nr:hypothetical protein [Blastocatellia bacterium]